jgi:tetratricopeptide (TPR) repeat protein
MTFTPLRSAFAPVILLAASCATVGSHRAPPAAGAGEKGFAAWLDGDPKTAERLFTTAPPDDLRAAYGRALLAHERADWNAAWALWLAVLDGATRMPHDPSAAALADSAAHKLEQLVGEVPGERAQAAKLAALPLDRLPREARRRVLAMRASYARRSGHEQDARAFDRARGCPDRWLVAGSYGQLPRLDLMTPFAPEQAGDRERLRPVQARACGVTLEAQKGRSGVLYAVGWFRAARAQEAVAVIDTELPWRLYVDGAPAFSSTDEDRYPPRVQEVALPLSAGWHHVALKLAAPGGRAEAEIALYAATPLDTFDGPPAEAPAHVQGQALVGRALLPEIRESDPLSDYLAAHAAYRRGDADEGHRRLERLIARSPRFAPAQLLAAQIQGEDPAQPQRMARDRARRAFERALELDPTLERARYNLALMELNADRPREALARLGAAGPIAAHDWRFAFARYQTLKARGWQHEAEQALASARRLNPEACPPLEAATAIAYGRHEVAAALALARLASTCGAGSDELADLQRSTGDLAAAIAEYRRLLALDPMRESWRAGLGETLAQAGDLREAASVFGLLVARYPRAAHYRLKLADTLYGLGDAPGARRVIEEGLAETPESQELERALAGLCDGPSTQDKGQEKGGKRVCSGILDPFRLDGKQVIAEFERGKPSYQSPAVIVLDRTVTRVFPTGARLTLTHNIVKVQSKDGVDRWGEVTIPADADVLTLRAIKADGSTREPEEIAEKESISLPDLEVGDYVEFEYVDPSPPPGAFRDGFLAERFYFRSYDAPLYRTEYVVAVPRDMPLQIDRRGKDVPAPTLAHRDGLSVYTFASHDEPQLFAEPAATPFEEFVPSVRVGARLSVRAWKDFLRDQQIGALRANERLRAIATAETRDSKSAHDKLMALDAWVRRHIKHGGSLDEPATSILAREEGNRVTLLAALLRAVGVPSELWLVHPPRGANLDGALPDLEGYDHPILVAAGMQVDPHFRHAPAGFLAPTLRGGRAFRLTAGEPSFVHVDSRNPDERGMDFDVQLSADGSAEVSVRERLSGWPALEWREALEKLAPDRVQLEFEQQTLGFHFPGATLQALGWKGADDDAGAFVIEYKFRAPQLARRVGRGLVLPAPFAATLGKRYVGVAARKTPLLVDYAAPTRLHARIRLPEGPARWEPTLLPSVKAEAPFGTFEQTATRAPGGVDLDARFSLAEMRLGPERYPELVEFAQRVDRAEAKALEIGPQTSQ